METPATEYVTYYVKDHIATIRLNRPERLNAYGRDMRSHLAKAFARFDNDAEAKVAIVVGAGTSFCAGRDLKEESISGRPINLEGHQPERLNRYHVQDTTKPIIAAVHGYAIGAGFGLMLGCDYRIAAEDAVFAYTEIATGVPGPWDLAIYQVIPWGLAAEIALLGRRISARRLYEIGLVNEVVPPGKHEDRAYSVAEEFLRLPQDILRATKELMILGRPRPVDRAITRRAELGRELADSPSRAEAIRRFSKRGT